MNEVIEVLSATPDKLRKLIDGVSKESLSRTPAHGKWSAATILAHLADSEIVYAFRLRLMLSSSGIVIQGTDQDAWASTLDYAGEDPAASVEDFRVNRERTLRLLSKLSNEQWECYGMHTERGRETVRRMIELLAAHDLNHMRQIQAIVGNVSTTAVRAPC
jgi:hypothetical protein